MLTYVFAITGDLHLLLIALIYKIYISYLDLWQALGWNIPLLTCSPRCYLKIKCSKLNSIPTLNTYFLTSILHHGKSHFLPEVRNFKYWFLILFFLFPLVCFLFKKLLFVKIWRLQAALSWFSPSYLNLKMDNLPMWNILYEMHNKAIIKCFTLTSFLITILNYFYEVFSKLSLTEIKRLICGVRVNFESLGADGLISTPRGWFLLTMFFIYVDN